MLFLVAHLGPQSIGIMRPDRLNPFRPFLRRIGGQAPKAVCRVRCPILLGSMGLNTLVKGAFIAADLAQGIVYRIGPFRKQISVFRRRYRVNAPGFRHCHKHDPASFIGFGDFCSRISFFQTDGFRPIQSIPAKQMVHSPGKNNARSIMLRAKDIATIFGLFNVVQIFGQANVGPVFDDPIHFAPPKKIA